MSMVFDEYGRPFIILRDQEQKERVKGIEAIKVRRCCVCVNYGSRLTCDASAC